MSILWPHAKDELHPGYTSTREINAAILALQDRIGMFLDEDPASIEDRLHTAEILLAYVTKQLSVLLGVGTAKPGVKL